MAFVQGRGRPGVSGTWQSLRFVACPAFADSGVPVGFRQSFYSPHLSGWVGYSSFGEDCRSVCSYVAALCASYPQTSFWQTLLQTFWRSLPLYVAVVKTKKKESLEDHSAPVRHYPPRVLRHHYRCAEPAVAAAAGGAVPHTISRWGPRFDEGRGGPAP